MRLLLIGSDKIHAIENFYVKYLREIGVDVVHLPTQSTFYDYYHDGILNKLKFRLGISGIYGQINAELRNMVEEYHPTVLWVFKGMEILPATLKWVRSRGIKLVNYNPDNPFLFSGKGSGNQNITDSIGLYDLHFTYNLEIQRKFHSKFNVQTAFLPFGFDIAENIYEECNHLDEILGACFLGNPDKNRVDFIHLLVEKGIEISVYGHGWEKYIKSPGIKSYGAVYGIDQLKVLRKYRVQINLMRIHNENSHNMRTFEVPGIGGIMVAPDTEEHRLFFEDRKEVFLFKGVDDCADIIRNLLDCPSEKAMEIRRAARSRSTNSGYSYRNRSEQVLKELECLLK